MDKALSPLANFTDIFSGEKYVTFSPLSPILKHLEDNELYENSEDTTFTIDIREVKACLQDKYDRNELQELLYLASFLDPRFKMTTYQK